jgi:hypothetical protein
MERTMTKQIPQMFYSTEFDRWALAINLADCRFEMLIDTAYKSIDEEEFDYRFIEWVDGDWYECVTQTQYDERVADIEMHEGEEVAAIWKRAQNQVHVVRNTHPVFDLKKHWEAMMQLQLFDPSVTLAPWKGKPLPAEIKAEMDAVLQREVEKLDLRMAEEAAERHAEDWSQRS